jgi:hypothetical protein
MLPGGDAQSETCLERSFMRPGDLRPLCVDMTLIIDYTLQSQPDMREEKKWRFVLDEHKGNVWVRHLVESPNSPCAPYLR